MRSSDFCCASRRHSTTCNWSGLCTAKRSWTSKRCLSNYFLRVPLIVDHCNRSNLAVQFRTKLMFFIDNMFMYLQVDVVESRFNALITAIRSCEDFLVIQKEHSLFQIMILSHCFLLSSSSANATQADKMHENEVLMNLERILSVVNVFAEWQLEADDSIVESQVPGMNSLEGLCDQFDSLLKDFMIRLMGLKSGKKFLLRMSDETRRMS